jgi:hypothetical protein
VAGTIFGDDTLKNRLDKKGITVNIDNRTSYPLNEVYYAPDGAEQWSENALGDKGIEPWGSATFVVPVGK